MTEPAVAKQRYLLGLYAVTEREILKFLRQRERLLSAIVRPALWLFVFAAGLQNLLGISIIDPYKTYTPYQEYILPGLCGIIVLFQCMQSALSMVYDREAGVMRVMLVSPLPRTFLLFAKILSATILSALQIYVFLGLAALFGFWIPPTGMIFILPAIFLTGMMLGSIGLLKTRMMFSFCAMSVTSHVVPRQPKLHWSRHKTLAAAPVQADATMFAVASAPPEQPVRPARLTTSTSEPKNRKTMYASRS